MYSKVWVAEQNTHTHTHTHTHTQYATNSFQNFVLNSQIKYIYTIHFYKWFFKNLKFVNI